MANSLPPQHELATKIFIETVNNLRQKVRTSPVTWSVATKFLAARKWDVGRAVTLYEAHEATRLREGLLNFDPTQDPLKSELSTGKFTVLPTRDQNGAAIAVFTARIHSPLESSHQTTLQGVVYQLDVALESIDTQRYGLVFIYDMSDSKYSNFDYELSQKILTLLKGGYPAKLKKVLIVTAPLWFKAPFKILRLFVREKLRDRVFTISVPQLTSHIPRESLPVKLGGTLEVDHAAWLLKCLRSMTNREQHGDGTGEGAGPQCVLSNDGADLTSSSSSLSLSVSSSVTAATDAAKALIGNGMAGSGSQAAQDKETTTTNGNAQEKPMDCGGFGPGGDEDDEDDAEVASASLCNNPHTWDHDHAGVNGEASSPAPPSSASSGFSSEDSLHCDISGGMKIEEFVEYVRSKGNSELVAEYVEIKLREADGSFNHARLRPNAPKNRYSDVLCFDHSRVLLSQIDDDTCSDYINANFVDGYKQKNAFISTQGPLPKTSADFWRMIWEQQVLVVVMTTRVVERGRTKCGQYWSPDEGGSLTFGNFEVTTDAVEQNEDYTVTSLTLTNTKTEESRTVSHMQFTSWPDYGVPQSAQAMLEFLERVRSQQATMVTDLGDTWAGHPKGPPIVVHCSAGIGRTGTFCTLDICIARLEDVGTVDVRGTVERIRSQRAFSIQMPDQYVFCHLALIEYASLKGLLTNVDLDGLEKLKEDDSD
ncbi:Tyrosine-protein phosphatase non-receptor type 9 [Frankliniella fusca]|uniref:Tyrosine-protein phosphatase non-receptor type 9 n=1 Tax=Frankliniella fusca TaxID=407009 RepID=A0AAE1I092_9NEOP|nr:Tyrosine-protein phosphatase non-receptor type 9 [Frankliniella fusca]